MVTGNGTASSALALSKRRGQRAHRPHHHTAVIRCFMVPRAKFINGQVLGVVFAAATDDSQTGYALTAEEVTPDAVAGHAATVGVSTGGCD